MEKLCKALTAEYKVKYPIRYKFKVKKSKGLPEITWYRIILHRYPDEELEEKEVSEGVLRRFSNALGDPAVSSFARPDQPTGTACEAYKRTV
ncbi:hypothetical protein [Vibrio mediterranei]|uniref:hypothetical protein n=1 Tax=Vibrio mediterranei TaxID=689 RepID=UPI0020A3FB47|nr:hypothetical protein [Vibrio mediterranei]